jgi:hypothetical protein
MALRKLAGPFPILDQDGNPPSNLGGPACYVPYMGLVIGAGVGIIAHDGLIQPFASGGAIKFGWDVANQVVLSADEWDECVRDPRSFMGYFAASAAGTPAGSYAMLSDRRIYCDGSSVIADTGGVITTECPDVGFRPGQISAGRNNHEVLLAVSDRDALEGYAQCRFYDTDAKAPSSPILFATYDLVGGHEPDFVVVFAPELQLIVGLFYYYGTGVISLFSLSPLPASVTDPVLFSGSTAKGNIAQYRCQVLGDQGEPCAGELVDWSITGDGDLLDQQSAADANGFATARVFYRLGDGGDSVVTASVTC